MHCRILTQDGRYVTEGLCGVRRDGGIELVTSTPSGALREDQGPLVLATGSSRYPVRVEGMHGSREESQTGTIAVYHLAATG
jgi:hypothetical protein